MRPLVTWEHRDPDADVLIVTSGYPTVEKPAYCPFMQREVETLVRKGVRCDVLLIRGFASRLAYPLATLRLALSSAIGRPRRYRIVHAHSGEAALAATLCFRAPLLVSYWGDDLLGTPDRDGNVGLAMRMKRGLIRRHSARATATITMTSEMQNVLPARVRARNVVVPDGVDPTVFRPLDRNECRDRLGWSRAEPTVLFAADPGVPRKRFWLAEAAVKRARELVPDATLRVATALPPSELPWYMNAADCLVLPSSIEGSPNVVKEALMCNLPVVATAVGDVPQLLAGVEPSAVCASTPEALGSALAAILSEPRRSNGRVRSMSYSVDVVYERIVERYRQLTDGAVGGPVGVRDVA
jgi:glycosyltransferase involved in cell wall biosynthesis